MNKQDLMKKRNDAMREIRHSNKIGSIEILYSEEEKSCLEKSKKYPSLFVLEMVKINNNMKQM